MVAFWRLFHLVVDRNAHVFARGDGAAEVTNDAIKGHLPRGVAPWAIRGIGGGIDDNLPGRTVREASRSWPTSA